MNGACEDCGESMDGFDVNVEAFEITGLILCPGCADAAFERDEEEGLVPL